jgi:hypothetical protein
MKYLIFCIMSLSFLNAEAQSKFSFDVEFGAGTVFSRSKPIKQYSPAIFLHDPNTGTTAYIPRTLRTTNEYKNILTPQFFLGVKTNYTLKHNLKIYAGVSFSYMEAKRKNTLIIPNPFGNSKNSEFITTELLKFYNFDIPLGVTYIYNKWSFNIGITPSIILNSKFAEIKEPADPQEITPYYPWTNDPTYPRPSTGNKAKNYISLLISPLYQLNSRLKIGIEYKHGLTRSYYTDDFSSEYYQSMKTSSLGLKILYKLK